MNLVVSASSKRLKYAASIEMGQSPPSGDYSLSPDQGLAFLQGTADFGAVSPLPRVYCASPTKVAEAGDILFSVRAPVGELNIADQEYGIGRGLCAIRCYQVLEQRFAWWVLHHVRTQLAFEATGSTYEAVSAEDVANLFVPLPPLPTQRAIADYLDRRTATLDKLIAAKERLLEVLAEKRRALVTHAITRGLNPDAPRRDSGIEWLGEIPAHWELLPLRRLLTLLDYGISESVGFEGNVAVLRMGDISEGEIIYSKIGFVENVDSHLLLAPNDLLFNRTNSLDQVGKVGIFRGHSDFEVSFASYLVRLRCNTSILPEFLNFQLNAPPMLAWARSEALPAIGQANLNPNRYSYLPTLLPPIAEQRAILAYLKDSAARLDSFKTITLRSLALLRERRAALIAAAVTGQLRVE